MSAPKFTPGPWVAAPTDNRGWRTIKADGTALAEVFDFDRRGANAALITAAPELYAALKAIIDVEHHDSDKRYVDALAPLIIKAIQVLEKAAP